MFFKNVFIGSLIVVAACALVWIAMIFTNGTLATILAALFAIAAVIYFLNAL